jgi:hypothetical protein
VRYRPTANATRAEEKIDAVPALPLVEEKIDAVPALPPVEQTADALPVAAVMVAQVAQTVAAEAYRNAPAAGLAANTIAAVAPTAGWVVKVAQQERRSSGLLAYAAHGLRQSDLSRVREIRLSRLWAPALQSLVGDLVCHQLQPLAVAAVPGCLCAAQSPAHRRLSTRVCCLCVCPDCP